MERYCNTGKIPNDIPKHPEEYYKGRRRQETKETTRTRSRTTITKIFYPTTITSKEQY